MKKLLILTAKLFTGFLSFAQIDSLRQKLDSIFQHVDKTQIPTGYLKEYGAEFMPIHCLNGVLTTEHILIINSLTFFQLNQIK